MKKGRVPIQRWRLTRRPAGGVSLPLPCPLRTCKLCRENQERYRGVGGAGEGLMPLKV